MDRFAKRKQDFLSKIDKSKKGSIDEKMVPIVELINKGKDHYTTSCCAGRIVLLHQVSGKKQGSNWLFSSHSPIKASQLRSALSEKKLPKKGMVWLLAEAPIIHVACRTIDDAWKLISIFKQGGFKRASIISSTENKTTIEAFGNQRIEMPIARDGELLVPLPSIQKFSEYANKKLKNSHQLLRRLSEELER